MDEARIGIHFRASPEGARIEREVRQSRQKRKVVEFRPDFLQNYPQNGHFLSEPLRDQLHRLGTPPESEKPTGSFAQDILQRLVVDLSWASSHLEGITYSLAETEKLIENGLAAEGKGSAEAQMVRNHQSAIELLVNDSKRIGSDRFAIPNLHAILSDGLLAGPRGSGRIREEAIEIVGIGYQPPGAKDDLENLFGTIRDQASKIGDPFEKAFFTMVSLSYLQPFENLNEPVSRLAANIPLVLNNLCPLSFVDVPLRAYRERRRSIAGLQGSRVGSLRT
jgi:Fic family protein